MLRLIRLIKRRPSVLYMSNDKKLGAVVLSKSKSLYAVSAISLGFILASCDNNGRAMNTELELGAQEKVGSGTVSSYAEYDVDGTPLAIGVQIPEASLKNLPSGSDHHHCADINGDGEVTYDTECAPEFEYFLPLPSRVDRDPSIPFRWAQLNWNPAGHPPAGVYSAPHFDVHFYMVPIAEVAAIDEGFCEQTLVRCDIYDRAMTEVPAQYVPEPYISVGSVVPGMGNHLINPTGPEFNGAPFTRTWIVGAYDGRITFLEEMVTLEYLQAQTDICFDVPQPSAFEAAGYYPTLSCMRHDLEEGVYTISLEGFVYRDAS